MLPRYLQEMRGREGDLAPPEMDLKQPASVLPLNLQEITGREGDLAPPLCRVFTFAESDQAASATSRATPVAKYQ